MGEEEVQLHWNQATNLKLKKPSIFVAGRSKNVGIICTILIHAFVEIIILGSFDRIRLLMKLLIDLDQWFPSIHQRWGNYLSTSRTNACARFCPSMETRKDISMDLFLKCRPKTILPFRSGERESAMAIAFPRNFRSKHWLTNGSCNSNFLLRLFAQILDIRKKICRIHCNFPVNHSIIGCSPCRNCCLFSSKIISKHSLPKTHSCRSKSPKNCQGNYRYPSKISKRKSLDIS